MGSLGYAEVFLPLEKLEVDKITIHPPISPYPVRIPISHLSYTICSQGFATMPKLSILTPFLKIHSWDPLKGRLELIADDVSLILQSLQEALIQKIIKNPAWSSLTNHTYAEVKGRLQPIILNNILPLYLNNQGPEGITINNENTINYNLNNCLQQGQQIRVALKFQGLIFLKNSNGGLFYRLQHQVTRIYCK